jgi:hypothetical protein
VNRPLPVRSSAAETRLPFPVDDPRMGHRRTWPRRSPPDRSPRRRAEDCHGRETSSTTTATGGPCSATQSMSSTTATSRPAGRCTAMSPRSCIHQGPHPGSTPEAQHYIQRGRQGHRFPERRAPTRDAVHEGTGARTPATSSWTLSSSSTSSGNESRLHRVGMSPAPALRKAPFLICSGAASRRGLPYGGSSRW